VLGPRQGARAAGALAIAAVRIGERLDAGDRLRDDGFFEPGADGRADAQEVLEGTVLTAANSWEERKIEPLGRLYANLAFDDSTPAAYANFLIRLTDRLTYRQLTILAFFREADDPGKYERALVDLEAGQPEGIGVPDPALIAEMNDLSDVQLLGARQNVGPPIRPQDAWGDSSWTRSTFIRAALMPVGLDLHRLMELHKLPPDDLDGVLDGLRGGFRT
jgi:hypothetical protein